MTRYFDKFIIDKLKQPYKSENIKTKTSVKISFFDGNEKLQEELTFAEISTEEIYNKIENNEPININNCFVENFSLSDYKKQRNLKSDDKVVFNEFSAVNSFFYNFKQGTDIDFSNSEFNSQQINFTNTYFISENLVSFENSIFNGNALFDYSLFKDVDVSFNNTIFNKKLLSFKNTVFTNGIKKFENIEFRNADLNLTNTELGEGDIHFTNSVFISGNINFKVTRFGKGLKDFIKVDFGKGDINFEKVNFNEGDVNFRATTFGHGKVNFTRCEFTEGDIAFTNVNFGNGDVSFAGTDFGDGKVSFKLAQFGVGKLDFHYSKFGDGTIIFERTTFEDGNVDFRAVDFGKGRISFNKANFGNGDVIFEASELSEGKITFKRTVFGAGNFNFETAQFANSELTIDDVNFGQGKVSFRQSKFALLSLESSQMNNYFDLRVEKCGKLDLSNTIVKDIVDIDAHDSKTNIKGFDISGIRLLGRIYLDWKQNNVKNLILQQDTSYANKAEQFRILKENYNLNGQYDSEDAAYIEFKRAESKDFLEKSKKKPFFQRIKDNIEYYFSLLIFDKVGLYATNPIRVLVSMTVIFLFFSFLYILLPIIFPDTAIVSSLFESGDIRDLTLTQKAFYHSAITFLTIGYGDYYPTGAMRWLSGVEGFIGLFLMSYFTVAFVRKILR